MNTLLSACLAVLIFSGSAASNSVQPAQARGADPVLAPTAPLQDGEGLKESRLEQLWQRRHANSADFPIGPGDIIAVSVPGLPDFDNSHGGGGGGASPVAVGADSADGQSLDNWTVRVSEQGNINLPLLGEFHVAGLTEEQLRAEVIHLLGKYMYNPQVELFVRSYKSRLVSVSGQVRNPGMYALNGPHETIRDLIMQAGGTTDGAGSRIVLTPAPIKLTAHQTVDGSLAAASDSGEVKASDTNPLSAPGVSGMTLKANYVIDLSKGPSTQRYLNMPARPGDTIYVPRAGSATIIGWVYNPKTVDITPGLTILNAVSQAGGTLFAADPRRIKILRQGAGHQTETLIVNLDAIKEGKARDPLVKANDVIDVPYSAARIPGYALYYAAQGVLSFTPAALLVNGL